MAESTVQVNSGSGPKLHTFNRTIGANSVEDEVVIQGEPYLASYICNFGAGGAAVSTATANSHIFQIMAGATLKVRIRRIQIWQAGLATAAALANLSLVRLTTAGTGGTAQQLAGLDPSDAAAGASFMTLPTVKGTEGTFFWFGQPYFYQTAAASTAPQQPLLDLNFDLMRTKPPIIAAGLTNGIALKNQSAVAGATVWANVWIDESNF